MRREELAVFVRSSLNNRIAVLVHAVAGMTTIAASFGITVFLAIYFDINIFNINKYAQDYPILSNKVCILILATCASIVLLISRFMEKWIEAKVIIAGELWMAEKIRSGEISGSGNLQRASNYYGRLSASSMMAASTVTVLAINLITMAIILPPKYFGAVLLLIGGCVFALFLVMRLLSRTMSSSSDALAQGGKKVANWKANAEIPYDDGVHHYYSSYFRRIFLASALSFSGPMFSIIFCIGLLAIQETGKITLNLGEVFVALTLLQAYVNVIGKFFGTFVHGAAFIPALRPFLLDTPAQIGDTGRSRPFDDVDIE